MVTKTTYRTEYRDKVNNFIRKVIQHRRLLITRNMNTKNLMRCNRIISHLDRQLRSTNYTNKGMAIFFLQNQEDIRYLIRPNDVEKFNEFNNLIHLSETYKYL